MKSIRQFRYYGRAAENNYTVNNWPQDYNWERLYNGNIFSEYSAITKLGIQARPGTIFYLNDGKYPIAIGKTGIYEIDLEGYGTIFKISFDAASLEWYDGDGKGDKLLIDIVFEGGSV